MRKHRSAGVAALGALVLSSGLLAGCSGAESNEGTAEETQGQVVDMPTLVDTTSEPLDILLTNDDGWDQEGIGAVYAELSRAGHDVTVVAPETKQSGVGGAVTYSGSITVKSPDTSDNPFYRGDEVTTVGPGESGKGGTPSDCVFFALSELYTDGDAPDLVVSGTNMGQNTSLVTNHSGTTGAAVTALGAGIPAIAVSAEKDSDYEPAKEGSTDYSAAAQYLATVVEDISDDIKDNGELPGGSGVSINYPMGEAQGVVVTDFDDSDPFEVTYAEENGNGEYAISDAQVGDRENLAVDTGALYQGYVTLTQIDPYYSVENDWVHDVVKRDNDE